jgi:type I restriction enzyme, S subunit
MNPELLLGHFNCISEAPDAILRLRGFILDLAVRGKLVEQDPNDEPAFKLVERIRAKKACLLKEGKIKQFGAQRKISANEIDYPLPSNWEPARIGDLLTVIRGASPRPKGDPKYFSTERTPYHWIKISDIRKHSKGRVLCDTDEFLTKAGMEKSVRLPKGTLVVTNSATIGVPIFLGFEGGCIHDGYLAFPYFPTLELSKDFFFVLFQTLQSYAAKKARGMAQLNLNTELVREFPLGLPPFAEQRRIVAKVDELMALCDRLEATQRERETRRSRLTAASHHHLNNGAGAAAFRNHAHFYINHLPTITTRPEQIPDLRRAVISLAVRGELVPQDHTDEPASILLRRIQAEKLRLVKEGKINREKPPIPARSGDLGFELRPGWEAARISQLLVELQTGPFGSSLHESDYERGGIPVINPASIKNGLLIPIDSMAVGPATLKRLATFKLRANDIVMARRGEMGRCGVVTEREAGWLCGTGSLILRLPDCLFPLFFVTLIGSPFVREYLGGSAVGATMQNLNQSILLNLVVGLPPLAEQHRIVAKVDELMTLCDRLEAQLTTAQAVKHRLLEAVLYQSLAVTP